MPPGTLNGTLDVPAIVVSFELPEDFEALRDRQVSELQVERSPAVRNGTIDAGRVMVSCDLDAVDAHASVLERLQLSPSVHRTLCILRGRPRVLAASEPRVVLPPIFRSADLVALWVGDPRGVVWAVGSSRAHRLTVFPPDEYGAGAFNTLVEVLRVPEVFDAVVDASRGRGAMSPALRIVVPDIADAHLLESAEIAAIQDLTAVSDPGSDDTVAPMQHEISLDDLLAVQPVPTEMFAADGRIGMARAAARQAIDRAHAAFTSLRNRPTRQRRFEMVRAMSDAADAVEAIKHELAQLFGSVEASNGLDEGERGRVRAAGVSEQVLESYWAREVDADNAKEKLYESVKASIRGNRTLAPIAGELRALARLAKPRESAQTMAELERSCPAAALERLRKPPPLIVHADATGVTTLSLFGAAAVWWPGVWRALPLLMLVVVAAAFAWLTAERPWKGWRTAFSGLPGSSNFAIRAFALIIGVLLGIIVLVGVGDTTALHVAGLVLAPVLLAGYVLMSARSAIDRWASQWGIAETIGPLGERSVLRLASPVWVEDDTKLGALLRTAREVIGKDWLSANARMGVTIVADRLASTLEAVCSRLVEVERRRRAERREEANAGSAPQCNPAIRSDLASTGGLHGHRRTKVVEETLLGDYLDAIVRGLEEAWPLLSAKVDERSEEHLLSQLDPWLAAYRAALGEFGLFGHGVLFDEAVRALLSESGRRRRTALLDEIWRSVDLDSTLGDRDLVQFCRAEDVILLDQDEDYGLIPFAPATAGPTRLGVVRTQSMLMAGVLRLVPVRATTIVLDHESSGSLASSVAPAA